MRNEAFWKWFDEGPRTKLRGRRDTFVKMFEHLDTFDGTVNIIETGCSRRDPTIDDSWGLDGCSTLLFDKWCQARDGADMVFSVDISMETVEACRKLISRHTHVMCADSVKHLKVLAKNQTWAHLIYLDSFDYEAADPLPASIHHHAELMAAMPMIKPSTMVVIDDSPPIYDANSHAEIGGKGLLVAKHMALVGADMEFCQYQAGWTNVRREMPRGDDSLLELVERARAHVEADRIVAAEALYHLILGLTTPPKSGVARVAHGEACAIYARMALQRSRLGAAADWYREAINADPRGTDYRLELVTKCYIPMGNLDSALTEAERATRIDPGYPRTWKILGGVHHEMSNLEKSIECYDKRLAMEPDDPDALLDRAMASLSVPDYATTIDCCDRAMGSDREADAWHCLAMVAYREHRHEDAIELYDKAIAMGCDDPNMAHWNKSLAMHSIGQYKAGWVEHEYREHNRANPALYLPLRRFTLPRWKGEPPFIPIEKNGIQDVRPAVIHVHYEAGAGDNLSCVRYLNVLLEMGFRVRYETAPEMVGLMKTSFPEVEIVPKAPDYPGALGIQPFDYHIPIGSLPAVLGTDIDTVPWSGRYLHTDSNLATEYGTKFSGGFRRKVGICWSSGIRSKGAWIKEYGERKSMHYDKAFPIVRTCWDMGITPVSLQVGPERQQQHDILDLLPKRPTWAETAALIETLDLVITVDTSVAHLAGGMGKPVWLMCQRDGCSWHFMCWRPGASWNEASPWYPGMRIFRQREFDQPHYWLDVVLAISDELRQWKYPERVAAE